MVRAASRPTRSLGDEIRLDPHARFFLSNLGHTDVGSFVAHYKEPRDNPSCGPGSCKISPVSLPWKLPD